MFISRNHKLPSCIFSCRTIKQLILGDLIFDLSIARCIFPSVTSLTFKNAEFSDEGDDDKGRTLVDIINNILIFRAGPVKKFTLYVEHYYRQSDLDRWCLFLSRNGVEELIIKFCNCGEDEYKLPFCILSCRTIKQMSVDGPFIDFPVDDVGGHIFKDLGITIYSKDINHMWYEDLTCTNWINLALIPNVAIRQPGVKLRAAEDYSNRTQLVLGFRLRWVGVEAQRLRLNMAAEASRDLISELPLELKVGILECLPIRDPPELLCSQHTGMMFGCGLAGSLSILKFREHLNSSRDPKLKQQSYLDEWCLYLSTNGIEELDISYNPYNYRPYKLPFCIVSCPTIKHLRFRGFDFPINGSNQTLSLAFDLEWRMCRHRLSKTTVADASRDLISSLPIEIKHRTLECLSIEDAVRTALLSTHWNDI
nr:F-box/FBD/LRR-repeat protein At1g13570-like [Ipomoea batatas]